jgi:general secretion pathway protein G
MDRSLSYRANAFTLIEILVALTIIGVLLSFVAPMVLSRPDQARNLKIENDFSALETALNLFRLDTGRLPTSDEGLQILINEDDRSTGYLSGLPKDPWGNAYKAFFKPSGGLQIKSAGPDGLFNETDENDDKISKVFK